MTENGEVTVMAIPVPVFVPVPTGGLRGIIFVEGGSVVVLVVDVDVDVVVVVEAAVVDDVVVVVEDVDGTGTGVGGAEGVVCPAKASGDL